MSQTFSLSSRSQDMAESLSLRNDDNFRLLFHCNMNSPPSRCLCTTNIYRRWDLEFYQFHCIANICASSPQSMGLHLWNGSIHIHGHCGSLGHRMLGKF